jgi:nicotinamide-nucleotide amidase
MLFMEEPIQKCIALLADQKLTIAFAESVTTGALCLKFGIVPNSGKVFKGGIVCYDGDIKLKYLGVSKEVVDKYTPESAEVTEQMAKGLKYLLDADVSVAVTGLCSAGGSECEGKPVGTIFTNVLYKNNHYAIREVFAGHPQEIVDFAVEDIINKINGILTGN